MTYKEHYGTVENKVKEESQRWLEDIEKEGYLYYSEAACKHIDLLTKPECYMNEMELDAKRKETVIPCPLNVVTKRMTDPLTGRPMSP